MKFAEVPEIKQILLNEFSTFLYAKVEKQYENSISSIIKRNSLLLGKKNQSFTLRGEVFGSEVFTGLFANLKLDDSLFLEADTVIKEKKDIDNLEKPYVLGYIRRVLNLTDDFANCYALLPEQLHPVLAKFHLQGVYLVTTYTPEFIREYFITHASEVLKIKTRLATNLLI